VSGAGIAEARDVSDSVQIQSPRLDSINRPFGYQVEGLSRFNSRGFPARTGEFKHTAISAVYSPAIA
jgi:hypothetical protein